MATDQYGTQVPTDPREHQRYLAAFYERQADECANPNSPKARMMRAKAVAHRKSTDGTLNR